MARASPYRPFVPDQAKQSLFPSQSGNSINGLGESQSRRPSPVYWHDPTTLAHGDQQRWFYTRIPGNTAIAKARLERQAVIERSLPAVSQPAVQRAPAEWTEALLDHADQLDYELVGVTGMRDEWVFAGYEVVRKTIILIGIAHEYDEVSKAPELEAGAEGVRQYGRGLAAAIDIAGWLREMGWDAEPQGGPMVGPLTLIPPALACGFGELGKHGSIINRQHGSSFRLACVLTDILIETTQPEFYGVDEFCASCRLCEDACPPVAIKPEKQTVRGEEKWYVDFDHCLPFFNETAGCAICIAVCSWSRPGVGPRLADKIQRRASRVGKMPAGFNSRKSAGKTPDS